MVKNKTIKNRIIYTVFALLVVSATVFAVLKVKGHFGSQPLKKYSATFFGSFDTSTTIVGYAESEEDFNRLVECLQDELQTYNDLYDIYYGYSGVTNLKDINESAGKEPIKVDQKIIDLLKFSKELYSSTKGQTNIALGSVLKLWHKARNAGIADPNSAMLPSLTSLYVAEEHTDIEKIIINEENCTVYLQDSQMSLDVGSIGKGYAVQRLAYYARKTGVENLLISVGGNVCALGSHEDGTPWVVGIQNPDTSSSEAYILKVQLPDGTCAVTSGDYQRYYTVDDKKYCHIIDPDTLFPAEYFTAVTVIADDSGVADALSTALFCMDFSEGSELIESLKDVEAMWVFPDGTIQFSKGFQDYVVHE